MDKTYTPFSTPAPFGLTTAQREKAMQIQYNGRPLLNLSKTELLALCLEMNEQLGQMATHMRATMEKIDPARTLITLQ